MNGILLATIGWVITVIGSQRISIKQHTVNLLVNHNFSKEHRALVDTFLSKYPDEKYISNDDAQYFINCRKKLNSEKGNSEKKKLNEFKKYFTALVAILNYYEFIATGLKYGNLDKRLMHDYLRSPLCVLCEKSLEYIIARREKNNDPTIYENLVDLYRAWKPSDTFSALDTDQTTERTDSKLPDDTNEKG